MPKKNFPTIGDLQGYEYLNGVIVSVDGDTDTCTVTVNGADYEAVPIYYHCNEDSAEREDNGAIEGAAAGFSVEDPVIVLKQRSGLDDKIFVIGHSSGAKHCGFSFKITRDDGLVMTDAAEYAVVFTVKDEDENTILSTAVYDEDTEYWRVTLDEVASGSLFVFWNCENSVLAQYTDTNEKKYLYKASEFYAEEDFISPGQYEVFAPYWEVIEVDNPFEGVVGSFEISPTPTYINDYPSELCGVILTTVGYNNIFGYMTFVSNVPYKIFKKIKSSIDYKISYTLRAHIDSLRTKCSGYDTDDDESATVYYDINGNGQVEYIKNTNSFKCPHIVGNPYLYTTENVSGEVVIENNTFAELSPYIEFTPDAVYPASVITYPVQVSSIIGDITCVTGTYGVPWSINLSPATD